MSADDKQTLDDLKAVERAMIEARHALTRAMVGHGQAAREVFVFHLGFARGRLSRITERLYPAGLQPPTPTPVNDDRPVFVCPGCGAVSYNPTDIAEQYCARCHQFRGDDP